MPVLIYLLALAVFAQGTSEFMLAGLLPNIASDFNTSLATAGLLTSSFAVGMVIGAPVMAAFSRRWSPRLALSAFLAVFITMHIVGPLTDNLSVLLVTRVIAALANAGFLAVTLALVAAVVRRDRQSRAIAVILAGTTLALIAGVPGGAFIGGLLGWRAALWAVALICLPALVAVLTAAPRKAGVATSASLGRELGALGRPRLASALLLGAIFNGATFCGFTYLAPLSTEVAGLTAGAVPLVLAVFGLGAFLGVTAAGRLANRYASRVVVSGGVLLLAAWVLLGLLAAVDPAFFFAAVFVLGVLSFAVGSTCIALSMRHAAAAPTMGGSYATAALNVGATLGPIAGGAALATTWGAIGPVLASAVIVALGVLAALFAPGARRPA